MLKPSLCDYSDTYILARRTIAVVREGAIPVSNSTKCEK